MARIGSAAVVRLAIDDVRFAYGPSEVLAGVSLEIEAGEVVAVIGPNGAGKSTLLGVASGRLRPTSGSVRVDGDDVHALERRGAARRIAGLGPEAPTTFPYTVREAVALGRYPWHGRFGRMGEADERAIDEALRALDLEALARRPVPTLSSGERQRVGLARCLAQGGEVVLLDEPTAHLDFGHRVQAVDVLARRARSRGQALLAVLHDLNLAALADRLVLLAQGRVLAAGAPQEVLQAALLTSAFGAGVQVLEPGTRGPPDRPVVLPRPPGRPGGGEVGLWS